MIIVNSRIVFSLLILLSTFSCPVIASSSEPLMLDTSTVVGCKAPPISSPTIKGELFSLQKRKGKIVLLSFWSTRCFKCRDEMEFLQKMYVKLPSYIEVVGIVEESDYYDLRAIDRVLSTVDSWGITFPIILDHGHRIWNDYTLTLLPTSIIIDGRGRIQFMENYFYSETEENIVFLLDLLGDLKRQELSILEPKVQQ